MDAYACIMCYRCQEVCPAYNTGKVLSPAALEINKRYFLNSRRRAHGQRRGKRRSRCWSLPSPPEAVWACTACGACVDICPVGNEPMRDILDIRRALVLMENDFPEQLQTAFRGMERTMQPVERAARRAHEVGGRSGRADHRGEPRAGAAVVGGLRPGHRRPRPEDRPRLCRDPQHRRGELRRAGRDGAMHRRFGAAGGQRDIFFETGAANVEMLNEVKPKRIVTTCPHCLHTLQERVPGIWRELHSDPPHPADQRAGGGRQAEAQAARTTASSPSTIHATWGARTDRGSAPRQALHSAGAQPGRDAAPRAASPSAAGQAGRRCGRKKRTGDERVNANRFQEALATGAETLAVGCPFCMVMLNDAKKDANSDDRGAGCGGDRGEFDGKETMR